jgi:cell division protein FtsQ
MTDSHAPGPVDVKLMNIAAPSVLFWLWRHGAGRGVVVGAAQPGVLDRGITVTGDVAHNSAVTLRANVAPRLRRHFFTVDLAQTRQAFEAVPWVRRAVVQRDFPNRLRVSCRSTRRGAVGERSRAPDRQQLW